ncbi:MAG: GLUG motif-containing protein, partial [Paludibacteraceae bacterium]|nr:GLUG motif-containing protein [Paludibacteraceae bacterium]
MKTTQFRWLVTMLLLVTAMAMPKMAWAEITPTQPRSGDGTSANPYQIGTKAELYWFAALVNGTLTDGTSKNPSACAVLVKDITVNENLLSSKLDENDEPKDNVNIESWTPIGYYISSSDYVYYEGIFDGNGYSISGLYVKYTNQSRASFIGGIKDGCVKNIAILDSYFEGSRLIGGIVGYLNNGIINNCLFSGTVKSQDKVGGICGAIQGDRTISDCFSNAKILVDKADNYCGGICGVGWNSLIKLRNCVYNNSLYTGEAIKWKSSAGTVEHITGMETAEIASGKATYWLNRYQFGDGIGWHQNIDNGQTEDAYPVLDNTHGVVYTSQPCPSSGIFSNTKPSSSEGHNWGENNVCTKCGKTKDVLDLVEGFQEPSQVGGVYQISTAGELYWFTALVNGNGLLTDGTPSNNSANAVLTSDITVNSNVLDESGNLAVTSDTRLDWIPIGNSDRPYTGTFDGQGYTISGLYFNDSSKDYVGLFGELRKGKIQNTGIVDSYFNGKNNVGGLCGEYYNGSISYCYNTGAVSGNSYVGGLCGYAYNSSISYCYNTGAVSGSLYVGGLCGTTNTNSSGTISNCYFDNNKCNKDAVEGNVGTLTVINTSGKTTEEFASGEVAYLLNNSVSDGTQRWYQYLAAEGGEAYPNLNDTEKENRTVYRAYRHGEATLTYNNNNTHAHAYDSKAPDEENGNHDMSYEGQFTWTDNDNNATATATFTCSVCGKVVEANELTVVHDDSHTNTVAGCTTDGYNYYKTSYAFDGNTISDTYIQTLTALGHDMPVNASLNSGQHIYQKVCQRNGCGVLLGYYATSNGSVVANETESGFVAEALTLADATKYDNQAVFTATNFTYTRTFSNTNWTTWYVPFELTLTKDICDKFAFSRINNVHQYDTDNDG